MCVTKLSGNSNSVVMLLGFCVMHLADRTHCKLYPSELTQDKYAQQTGLGVYRVGVVTCREEKNKPQHYSEKSIISSTAKQNDPRT